MANKEYYLEKLAKLLEKNDIRKHTCINGVGYSQVERDIVDLFMPTVNNNDKLVEALEDIIEKQFNSKYNLANLNSSISNARDLLKQIKG